MTEGRAMEYRFPRFKAAAVQAASVFMDCEGTTDKACSLMREAARNGARLVVFPETYIAGYPHWNWLHSVRDGERFFPLLVRSSVAVPGPVTDRLCRAARECDIYVAMGINENSPSSYAEVFNTLVLIGPAGNIIGKHRKLLPTFYEKLTWSFGDGRGLRTYATDIGRLGMLICGENSNPLARFALIAQAEQVHISNYPALPRTGQVGQYNMRRAIEIRAAAHAFEGKVFTIASSSIIDDDIKRLLGETPEQKEILENGGIGFTGIVGPDGATLAGPLPDNEEGIVYADLDLTEGIKWKLYHDYSGNYNRFDILSLNLNRAARVPLRELGTCLGAVASDAELVDELKEKLQRVEDEVLRGELLTLLRALLNT